MMHAFIVLLMARESLRLNWSTLAREQTITSGLFGRFLSLWLDLEKLNPEEY